jgi:hypothetical protein
VGKKQAEMLAAVERQAREEEEVRLAVRTQKLKTEVEKKRKNDEKVLEFLNRATSSEEEAVAEWTARIEQLRARMEIER